MNISFVIPCYRSENTISSVVEEIRTVMLQATNYEYEIILVNDYSPDNVWDTIQHLAKEDDRIKGINLAKNFGQHAALMAGYCHACGDIVISLDDDCQTPANEALKLVKKINEGYDIVYAKYKSFHESAFRRFGSRINSKMAEYMIGKPRDVAIQSYFAARKFVIDEMVKYNHAYPYIAGLAFRTTRKVANVEVNHRERDNGKSGYTLSKLIGLWMNGFTAFSVKPLRIATITGAIVSLLGFLAVIYIIIHKIIDPSLPVGYSSTVCANAIFSGIIMLMLGIIGEYIGRIYICINNSPQYVIRDTVNYDKTKEQRK